MQRAVLWLHAGPASQLGEPGSKGKGAGGTLAEKSRHAACERQLCRGVTLAWSWRPATSMQGGALLILPRSTFLKSSLANSRHAGHVGARWVTLLSHLIVQ